MASRISNAVAILACDAIVNAVDTGGAGTITIYTGTAPAEVETAETGTILAIITCDATAFGNAADINPGARASLASVPKEDTNANATGTAGYFRFKNGAGTAVFQGDCGVGSGELQFNTVAIQSGAIVSITSFTVTVPET